MNKYKTLLSNTLFISMGTFGSKLLVFFMVRFYTGYLTPSDYSTADLLTQTANLLIPIISLGIAEGVFRFALDSNNDKKSVFSIGLMAIIIGSLSFCLIAPLLNLVKQFNGLVWLIVLYTICSSLHSVCALFTRARGKTALFALQGIGNTATVIILNIIFLAVFQIGVVGYVLSVVLADFCWAAFLFIKEKLWKFVTFKPDKKLLPLLLKYSIPLIPNTIFWWITSVSDRYMVTGFIGSEVNGLYTVSYKLPTLITLISTVFMQAWQFSAVTESEGDRVEHIKFFGQVWQSFQSIMFLVGSVIITFSKPLIAILTDKAYYDAWIYVPILCCAMVFSSFSSFMGSVYTVNKKTQISFITTFAGAAINIILNLILIPSSIGAQGAAIATVVSYFTVFVIRAINSRKYIPFDLKVKNIVINTFIILIQAITVILGFKDWFIISIVCVVAIIAVNYKLLIACANKMLSFFKRRK